MSCGFMLHVPSFEFLTSLPVLGAGRLIFGSHGSCLPFSSMRGMFLSGGGRTFPGPGLGNIGPPMPGSQHSPEGITTGCVLEAIRKRLKRPGRSLHVRHQLQPLMKRTPDNSARRARCMRCMGCSLEDCVVVSVQQGIHSDPTNKLWTHLFCAAIRIGQIQKNKEARFSGENSRIV